MGKESSDSVCVCVCVCSKCECMCVVSKCECRCVVSGIPESLRTYVTPSFFKCECMWGDPCKCVFVIRLSVCVSVYGKLFGCSN